MKQQFRQANQIHASISELVHLPTNPAAGVAMPLLRVSVGSLQLTIQIAGRCPSQRKQQLPTDGAPAVHRARLCQSGQR